MDWKAEVAKLPDIQAADREIDRLRTERRDLAAGKTVADLSKQVAGAEAALGRLRSERETVARQQRLDDLARQSEEADKKRLTERLYSGTVRSPRDLEGLQKNIAGSDERIGVLETRVLEAMERDEGLGARIAAMERALARDKETLSARRSEAAARIADIDTALGALEPRRRALAEAVAPPVLREYDRIRGRAAGVGAAVVSGGVCGACSVALPPLLVSRLARGDSLVNCEHCGRILVGGL